ncbi:MAG: hypothetical protein E6R09_18545 [Rhodocyclaceae bacterium]|nr:MAG: hypothetical protein E6R09_18545 [Rhodocyclaceae bacterium]
MGNKLKGLVLMAVGAGLAVAAVSIELAWLGVCFGTVIIGFLLLLFARPILLAPFSFLITASGVAFWKGLTLWKQQPYEHVKYVPPSAEDARLEMLDEQRIERQRRLSELRAEMAKNAAKPQ